MTFVIVDAFLASAGALFILIGREFILIEREFILV